jgi:hypothetical protein
LKSQIKIMKLEENGKDEELTKVRKELFEL